MRRYFGFAAILIAMIGLTACSTHYRRALEDYRRAEPIPFYHKTQDWIESAEVVGAGSVPATSPTLTGEVGRATSPTQEAGIKLVAGLFSGEVESIGPALQKLETDEQLDQALGDELRWEDLRLAVVLHNPAVKAARERWQATINQYNQATFLENLIAEYRTFTRYLRVETGKPLNKQMLQAFFPYPSTIALKGEMIREQVRLAELDWQRTMRDSVVEAGGVFFDYQYFHRAEAATSENIVLVEGLVDAIGQRYRDGTVSQADLLKVQTELERQRNMLADLRAREQAGVAKINALLERPPGAPLGRPEDTDPAEVPIDLATLLDEAGVHRQEINIQRAKVGRTEVAIRLGEVMNRPLFSQGYSAFERGMMPEASEGESRPPFGVRAKTQDRPAYAQAESYLAEMRKRLEAERSSLNQVEAQTQGMGRSILEELDVARREVALIRDIVLPQNLSTYRLTLTNYSTGEASFLDLLDSERALIAARLDLHESRRVLNRTLLLLATVRGTF